MKPDPQRAAKTVDNSDFFHLSRSAQCTTEIRLSGHEVFVARLCWQSPRLTSVKKPQKANKTRSRFFYQGKSSPSPTSGSWFSSVSAAVSLDWLSLGVLFAFALALDLALGFGPESS